MTHLEALVYMADALDDFVAEQRQVESLR